MNTLKIISRLGTVASVIAVGTIGSTVAGIGIAASAIAGLTAEQLIRWNTDKEREKICSELKNIIEKVEREYAQEVSRKLKESYTQVISDLKQNQLCWQQTQLKALMEMKRKPVNNSGLNCEQIVKQTNQLMMEIKTETNL